MATLFMWMLPMSAQTYYYKYLYTVKKSSGMKTNDEINDGIYITFTNGKNVLYESDKNGMSKSRYPCEYKGYSNSMHVYKETYEQNMFGRLGGWDTYTFSDDFSRMNYNTTISNYLQDDIRVFERSDAPEDQRTPSVLY